MKHKYKTAKYILPAVLMLLWLLVFALSQIPVVSEYVFARGISRAFNFIASKIGGIFPFSIYEWLVVAIVIAIICVFVYLTVHIVKRNSENIKHLIYILFVVGIVLVLMFTLFATVSYKRYTIEEGLGFAKEEVSYEKVKEATEYFIKKANALASVLPRDLKGNVVSGLSFQNQIPPIIEQFDKLNNGYLSKFNYRPKPVLMSSAMSYIGIVGIYMPYSGEVNINTTVLDYELPCIIAHELSHGKGVMREGEANILGYYICLKGNELMQYSACMNIVLDLLSEIKKHNVQEHKEIYNNQISPLIKKEWQNQYENYKKYDTFIDDISMFFNNIFIKVNGDSDGIKSYSNTTGYILGFFDSLKQNKI